MAYGTLDAGASCIGDISNAINEVKTGISGSKGAIGQAVADFKDPVNNAIGALIFIPPEAVEAANLPLIGATAAVFKKMSKGEKLELTDAKELLANVDGVAQAITIGETGYKLVDRLKNGDFEACYQNWKFKSWSK